LSSGRATLTIATLAVGGHSVTASYGGDANFAGGSFASTAMTVARDAAAVSVNASVNPATTGQAVTFTATVTAALPGAGTPTGAVTFRDGSATIGTGALAGGAAFFTTSALAVGGHSITASYAGDANFTAATSAALAEAVNAPAGTSTYHLWFTPARLAQAQAWYAAHPFTPAGGDEWGLALKYVLAGDQAAGAAAVTGLMGFTISQAELDGTASDNYRWADWVPVVYDWCHALLTPAQVSAFMARYNNYTSVLLAKAFGGPSDPSLNYYTGYWRN